MRSFFDTNVLVYAVGDGPKAARAQDMLNAGGVVSVQVLNELVAVMRRKLKASWEQVDIALAAVSGFCGTALPLTSSIQTNAVSLARRHQLFIYDATIVAAALDAGCDTLWSEDLQEGRRFSGLTIRNPFAPHPS